MSSEKKKKKILKKKKSGKKKKENKYLKSAGRILLVGLAILLFTFILSRILLQHYIQKMNYIPDYEVTLADIDLEDDDKGYYIKEDVTDEAGSVVDSAYVKVDADSLTPEEQESLEAKASEEAEEIEEKQNLSIQIPMLSKDGIYHIMLIGTDVRPDQSWNGNSDSMILVSINTDKNKILLTSFMRDLYANIPGVGNYKLNSAHAVGGGPLLVQTISSNYRIDVEDYVRVNFYSMIQIIDSMGGIDLDIREEEVQYVNKYVHDMGVESGQNWDSHFLNQAGKVHLNGIQAVAYARIRYVGNADFERTERQRKVLLEMYSELKRKNLTEINAFLNNVLPLITHNMSSEKITELIADVPAFMSYTIESGRVPFDGLYGVSGELLVPDFEATIYKLHEMIE